MNLRDMMSKRKPETRVCAVQLLIYRLQKAQFICDNGCESHGSSGKKMMLTEKKNKGVFWGPGNICILTTVTVTKA